MIPVEQLTRFCNEAFLKAGLNSADSQVAAEALVLTDTWGVHTHGVKNLPGYIRRLLAGGINSVARPRRLKEGPAWAMVDADGALGMIAATSAMNCAVEKARACGIGYAGVRNTCHFGAAGVYSLIAARAGLIGLAMSNDTPTVSVPGSSGPVLGSNPLSYAIPLDGSDPILLDIATSAVAGGKVFNAAVRGQSIPEGWIIDEQGLPTTDPALFPHRASLTPMAGHKGYGIALLIETLSAILTGAAIGQHVLSWSFSDPALATNHGAAFLAIDPNALLGADHFQQRLQQTVTEIRSAPLARGAGRILLPGEREWQNRQGALQHGLNLPAEILQSLRQLALDLSLSLPAEN